MRVITLLALPFLSLISGNTDGTVAGPSPAGDGRRGGPLMVYEEPYSLVEQQFLDVREANPGAGFTASANTPGGASGPSKISGPFESLAIPDK